MKNLIKKYNTKNTILVVSSYPDKKHGIEKLNAVAWYARKTFKNLAKIGECKIVVLAEVIDKPEVYLDGKVLIVRAWRPNRLSAIKDLSFWIFRFDEVKTVLLEFEFNMFGGILGTLLFPFFLLALKILRKRIVLELHQVVLDINSLSGHLNLKRGGFLSGFFNLVLNDFYLAVCLLSSKVIVLEEELKRRLSLLINPEKIAVLPIAAGTKPKLTVRAARLRLGIKKDEFVLLYFGFIAWYKGADWLVKTIRDNRGKIKGKKLRLIVAGGESPTLKNKPHYQKFYQSVLSAAKKARRVQITGFVKERDIPTYFAACDLVVLPYRTFMSASGPLSWALTFQKPFLLSLNLRDYFKSPDFHQAQKEANLSEEDVLFALNSSSLTKKLRRILVKSESRELARLTEFSSLLAKARGAENVARTYLAELDHDYHSSTNIISRPSGGELRSRKLAVRLG